VEVLPLSGDGAAQWRWCRCSLGLLLTAAALFGCALGMMLPLSVVDFSVLSDRPTSASPVSRSFLSVLTLSAVPLSVLPLRAASRCCRQGYVSVLPFSVVPCICISSAVPRTCYSVMLPSDADPSCLPVLSHALTVFTALSLCSRCALDVLSMCSRCALAVLSLCSRCALSALLLRSYCALTVLLSLCSLAALSLCSLCFWLCSHSLCCPHCALSPYSRCAVDCA
jgi:hypothetical protein